MKTNHQRGFVANDDAPRVDANWSTRMYRKMQSGEVARVKYWHIESGNGNRGISTQISAMKRDVRQQIRRDAQVVINQQLNEVE